jgi:hypothetical protein
MQMVLFMQLLVLEGPVWSFETIITTLSHGQAISPHLIDAEHPELLACWQGFHLAVDCQIQGVVLQTDSTGVADRLNRDEQDRSIHVPLVEQGSDAAAG